MGLSDEEKTAIVAYRKEKASDALQEAYEKEDVEPLIEKTESFVNRISMKLIQ